MGIYTDSWAFISKTVDRHARMYIRAYWYTSTLQLPPSYPAAPCPPRYDDVGKSPAGSDEAVKCRLDELGVLRDHSCNVSVDV